MLLLLHEEEEMTAVGATKEAAMTANGAMEEAKAEAEAVSVAVSAAAIAGVEMTAIVGERV